MYSDINFETLGFLVEKVTGMTLNEYASKKIFIPLGMKDTRFLPPSDWTPRIAPTQYDEEGHMLRGAVHDPSARRMGGVAGHAGLFSTADDLAKFAQALLSGDTILSRLDIEKMSTPQQPATAASLRGLGWDIDSPFASNRGELLPVGSFGHTGFTGTSLWIDPATDTYIIILTNAVHPNGHGSVVSLRAHIATAVADALDLTVDEKEKLRLARITGYNESLMAERRVRVRNGAVKAGIDVLEEHAFRELHPDTSHPLRIGLVANQTAVDAQGRRTADVLAHAPACGWRQSSAPSMELQARSIRRKLGTQRTRPRAHRSIASMGIRMRKDVRPLTNSPGSMRLSMTSRTSAYAFIHTKPRSDIFSRPPQNQARKLSCSIAPIRSEGDISRGRLPMPDANRS